MEYSNQAKRFVTGLREEIKGTPYEPLGMAILSQWIFESGHFRSKLCVELNNPGGIQWRPGCPVKAEPADYTDWEGKTRKHFKLASPEDFAELYLWFISGEGRFSEKENPYRDHLAYIEQAPKDKISSWFWLALLAYPYVASIDGIKREDYATQREYNLAVDDLYVKKIMSIMKREATRDLYDHRWLTNAACMFHKLTPPIGADKKQVQEDWPEWLLGPREGDNSLTMPETAEDLVRRVEDEE